MKTNIKWIVAAAASLITAPLLPAQTDVEPDPPATDSLRSLVQEYRDMRVDILTDRARLLAALREAKTDQQRRELIKAFRDQHRDQFLRARDLRKEYRLRMMELRRKRRMMMHRDTATTPGAGTGADG